MNKNLPYSKKALEASLFLIQIFLKCHGLPCIISIENNTLSDMNVCHALFL